MSADGDDPEQTEKSSPIKGTQEGGLDSTSACTICMEEWSISGDHRVSCLKCGHLFGRLCIEKWLKEKGSSAKCPTCNKPAKKADIRNLWCKTIKAIDTTELCELQTALEAEKKARKTDAAQIYHMSITTEYLHKEIDNLKKGIQERDERISRLQTVFRRYNQLRAQNKLDPEESFPELDHLNNEESNYFEETEVRPQELKGKFIHLSTIDSCATGGCRAFALCPTSCLVLVAQPTNAGSRNIFSGFGLRKFSTIDMNVRELVPLHSKVITSMQVKPIGDLVLTGAQDKKVKITSINNNTCIQEYDCANEPTCVAWSAHRDQQFYVASGNCYVALYDMRNISEAVYQRSQRVASTRLLSIAATCGEDGLNGLLANDAKGSQFIEVSDASRYSQNVIDSSVEHMTCYPLPFEGLMGTVDFHRGLGLSLVTTRRTSMNSNITHNLLKLKKIPLEDEETLTTRNTIEVSRVSTFTGSSTELISQSRILKHPTLDEHVLVGSCDSDARGIKLWDSSDNTVYQTINTNLFIKDIMMYNPENSNQHLLYLLSDRGMNVYRWDFA